MDGRGGTSRLHSADTTRPSRHPTGHRKSGWLLVLAARSVDQRSTAGEQRRICLTVPREFSTPHSFAAGRVVSSTDRICREADARSSPAASESIRNSAPVPTRSANAAVFLECPAGPNRLTPTVSAANSAHPIEGTAGQSIESTEERPRPATGIHTRPACHPHDARKIIRRGEILKDHRQQTGRAGQDMVRCAPFRGGPGRKR